MLSHWCALGTLPEEYFYFRSKKNAKALQKSFLGLFLWFAVFFSSSPSVTVWSALTGF